MIVKDLIFQECLKFKLKEFRMKEMEMKEQEMKKIIMKVNELTVIMHIIILIMTIIKKIKI